MTVLAPGHRACAPRVRWESSLVAPRPLLQRIRGSNRHPCCQIQLRRLPELALGRAASLVCKASEKNGNNHSKDLDDYTEVKVESVRVVSSGSSVVYLKVVNSNLLIPVHIGENESNALLKEINKQRQMRPITHDIMKTMLQAVGYRVTKIRITDIISNTYYARIHLAKGEPKGDEVDIDARPSDAINLAVRFGAPMYINNKIAAAQAAAQPLPMEPVFSAASETNAEIVRSVREALANYEDPTIMHQLQKELAIKEDRFEDAMRFQQFIYEEMTHNQVLRLVVAMEAALADHRYEEAARLRDEYKKLSQTQMADNRSY